MMKHIKNQRGDTIVEVLIAVVVIGLAIGLAYGISSRSLRVARQSQERVEAVKQAEGQIERLKSLAASNNNQDIFDRSVFCIADNNQPQNFGAEYGSSSLKATDTTLQGYPNNAQGTACVKGLYHLAIYEEQDNEFAVSARWFSIGNTDTEEVRIKYRLYPSQ